MSGDTTPVGFSDEARQALVDREAEAKSSAGLQAEQIALEEVRREREVVDDTAREAFRARVAELRAQARARSAFDPVAFYSLGARFEVARGVEHARLEALVYFGQPRPDGTRPWSGWSQRLRPGDVLTCLGWQPAFQHPTVLVPVFTAEGVPEGAAHTSVWPFAGLWSPWPLDGILTRLPKGPNHDR